MPAGSGSPEWPGKKLLEGDVTPEEVVVAYHERTKHHYHRFSASLGYMDWATQPDPVRRCAAGSAPAPRYLARAALLAALRARQRGADAAVDRLALAVLPLCPFPDQVESV